MAAEEEPGTGAGTGSLDPEAAAHIWRIISGYELLLPNVFNIYVHLISVLTADPAHGVPINLLPSFCSQVPLHQVHGHPQVRQGVVVD